MVDESAKVWVRLGQPPDLDRVVEFNMAMAWETEGKTLDPERLRPGAAAVLGPQSSRGFYYVAELSGRLVGQLLITTEWSDWRNGDFWWIQSVYVTPDHRRQGVYRTLHNYVLKEARQHPDVCGLRLYVDRDNRRAQSVYANMEMRQARYDLWEIDFVL